ncbi:peptidoglycan-binding protein [Curtobacterium sp. RRHDQ10]|uniref:peptidoglycan-binding protein n=1 Tax=Curtobacterium phyllosphaerae TaxID=3413379 RepID=UPI003BF04AF5
MTARVRRRTVVAGSCAAALVVVGLVVVGVVATVAVMTDPTPSDATTPAVGHHRTARVERGTLTEQKTFSATLGYGVPTPLDASAAGTITWLPRYGQVIGRDQELYRVDDVPVRAMHGTVPLFRPLVRGLHGPDVRQLNENLSALGYAVAVDDRFGTRTEAAVRRYQRDRGLTVDGTVDGRTVAFVDGDVRVAALDGRLGTPADGPVLGYTRTTMVVTATVPAADATRFTDGGSVEVVFDGQPDHVTGTVDRIDAASPGSGGGGGDGDDGGDRGTVAVTVRLDGPVPDGVSEASGVRVVADGTTKADVLSVPVPALLAGRGSGYVLEKVTASGSTTRVPVTVGFAAQGRVEVRGSGIAAGDEVVVPA